ncbi:hypothetical protein C8Q77DRAFT_17675 [Trametes polyzona]|nr:hypothetical protein C8Q77DRAFT_17675 [Trametes polyzona]
MDPNDFRMSLILAHKRRKHRFATCRNHPVSDCSHAHCRRRNIASRPDSFLNDEQGNSDSRPSRDTELN